MAGGASEPVTRPEAVRAQGPAQVLRIFVPFALGYFLSYVFRTVNSVIAPDLVAAVGLTASQLGLLSSAFFLAFAVAQLPLGMVLDRYGPRRVEASLLAVGSLGCLLFAVGDSLASLMLGRALIGLGVSGCMMAAFKAFTLWFETRRLPLVNGALVGCGATGALAATLPVAWLLRHTDWRGIFVGLAVCCLLVAALLMVVPGHAHDARRISLRDQLRGIGQVFRNPLFQRTAPLAMLAQGSFLSIQGLWAGPWLRDVAGLGSQAAASHLFVLGLALVAGFFALGALAERLARRGIRPVTVMGAGASVFALSQIGLLIPGMPGVAVILALFGVFGGSTIIAYAALATALPPSLAGRANTALNLFVFTGAFLTQWGMGVLIHIWEDPATASYGVAGYQTAFGSMILLQGLALGWFWHGWLRRRF